MKTLGIAAATLLAKIRRLDVPNAQDSMSDSSAVLPENSDFRVQYVCRECGNVIHSVVGTPLKIQCDGCGNDVETRGSEVKDRVLNECLICGSDDLYVRKDFKQKAGVFIVTIAVFVATVLYYYTANMLWPILVLVASAVADAVLYRIIPDLSACYKCKAEYRGMKRNPDHGNFSHYTSERYRALARKEEEEGGA